MANRQGILNLSKKNQAILKSFGEVVRRERKIRNWTLEDTESHGYSNWQHWQAIESGLKNISFITLCNVCRTLKTQPHKLLKSLKVK